MSHEIGTRIYATKLPSHDRQDSNIPELVYRWLSNKANGRWLLIVDGADDSYVFNIRLGIGSEDTSVGGGTTRTWGDFLPQSSHGAIVITSRSQETAYRLTGSLDDIITVDPMTETHALMLLRRKIGQGHGENHQVDLVRVLDHIPLAITQAAAYINQTPRLTVSLYLQLLHNNDRQRARLLTKDLGDPRRDGAASNSIIATWHSIPEYLVRNNYKREIGATDEFYDDVRVLTDYSLVTVSENEDFKMHQLVQFSTRQWLEIHGHDKAWKETYICVMNAGFPLAFSVEMEACRPME
ncbi:hypothetical protein DM02DRAFT_640492 [Periconia macrospinosa]|uniref:NB-ARC domain-containing protein n=1 Tax=Periconia macrospinosa TaxID=97972 RepID=A0A2V1DZ55_9PLEO|nr:hypothetical protein DM02DRAFT_640492 [Periconia macrospinosa]